MKKVIFWDSDGTLLYNNESFAYSFAEACNGEGYCETIENARRLMRCICSWYDNDTDHSDQNGEQWWQCLIEKLDYYLKKKYQDREKIAKILMSFRHNVMAYDYKAYDDAKDILKLLYGRGYRNYIISNNFPELGDVFGRLGLGEYISGYITSAEAGYEKPDSRIYEKAMEAAGNPEICYMIGDNPVTDYEGGTNAGMKAILVHCANANGKTACAELKELADLIP
ncbi:MAG: HAD family hydrolase [Clostridia bacterium]|nr:HAD family hydrolase [Clostridia bacterium]